MPWDASRAVITRTLFLPRKLEEARHATHFWEARELFITRITLFTHITARCNTAITPSRILSACIPGTLSEYLLSRSSTDLTTFANQHLRLPSFFQASFPIYSCLCVCSLCFVRRKVPIWYVSNAGTWCPRDLSFLCFIALRGNGPMLMRG